MGIKVFHVPNFRVQGLLFVGYCRVAWSTKFGLGDILRSDFAQVVFRYVHGEANDEEESFRDCFRSRSAIFMSVFVREDVRFVINGMLFKDAMRMGVAFSAARAPRVLTFRVDAHAPAMCLRDRCVLSVIRSVHSVPFNVHFQTLIVSRRFPIRPCMVRESGAFATGCCPASFPINERFGYTTM